MHMRGRSLTAASLSSRASCAQAGSELRERPRRWDTLFHGEDARGDACVTIRYRLVVDPRWDACADYAIRLLLEGVGVAAHRVADASQADIVYAPERPSEPAPTALWIRAAQVDDWNRSVEEVAWAGELPVLNGGRRPEVTAADAEHIAEDIVYSTYAIATGALERALPRSPFGVPVARDSGLSTSGVLERPVISMYCSHLASMLARRRHGDLERVPRWPMGKRYAVVLSHDVDRPYARPPWAFYGRRFRTNLVQRAPRAAGYGLMQMAKVAAVTRLAKLEEPENDPNFCFDAWIELESSLPAASCFYVAVTSSADRAGSHADVTYDFREPHFVAELRRSVEGGWEVGLHASINTCRIPDLMQDERAMLEGVLGGALVSGVRHHYWALDPDVPERTLWHQAAAGLEYDSSLGLNDAPGFRRGMMWPFQPFDRERGVEVPILEIPPTLMDGSIFKRPVTRAQGREQIEAHLRYVRTHEGAAVVDWHLEQLNPARLHGAGPVLRDVLVDLAADSDVFWATPAQLASWWQTRRERIVASA
jgi:hypothetical protein